MSLLDLRNKLTALLSAGLILSGAALLLWALDHRPRPAPLAAASTTRPAATITSQSAPLLLALPATVPAPLRQRIEEVAVQEGLRLTTRSTDADLWVDTTAEDGELLYAETFAAATRFDTVDPQITGSALQQVWQGEQTVFSAVAVLTETLPALNHLLGSPGPTVTGYATVEEIRTVAWSDQPTLALLPFEQLEPRLVVLAVDGQNPVENANHFDPASYPLIARYYLHTQVPAASSTAAALLRRIPPGNRDPARLTVIAMTGVTALCRQTAQQMDELGYDWPAAVVGPELALADITHISNEVPFVPGCETDIRSSNLTFCSKPEYMATLQASGVDIVGLTGNHQNDFGREDALQSLAIYAEAGIPLYGGGKNKAAAMAPFYLEHNGNRLAFLGANSYGPRFAWATDDQPGSAQFDLNIMSATIQAIKAEKKADIVLTELQYQESYAVNPLIDQRNDFRALTRAGADIVTGVQSHVPQAVEFEEGKLILYGLGNLYFDQMYTQPTREGMIVKHTIYQGRHLSTQILTTLLYDYGQPRWMLPEERTQLLSRVFAASYWE